MTNSEVATKLNKWLTISSIFIPLDLDWTNKIVIQFK